MGLENKKMQKKKDTGKTNQNHTRIEILLCKIKKISHQIYKRQRQTSYTSKGTTEKNDITIIIIYVTKNSASKYIKQQLRTEGDFVTLFLVFLLINVPRVLSISLAF